MEAFPIAADQLLDQLRCYEAEYNTVTYAEQTIVENVTRVGFADASKRLCLVAQQWDLSEKIRRSRIPLSCIS